MASAMTTNGDSRHEEENNDEALGNRNFTDDSWRRYERVRGQNKLERGSAVQYLAAEKYRGKSCIAHLKVTAWETRGWLNGFTASPSLVG